MERFWPSILQTESHLQPSILSLRRLLHAPAAILLWSLSEIRVILRKRKWSKIFVKKISNWFFIFLQKNHNFRFGISVSIVFILGFCLHISGRREVPREEAEQFAKSLNLIYIETSAKTSQNVDLAFMSLGEQVLEKIEKGEINPTDEVIFYSYVSDWYQGW